MKLSDIESVPEYLREAARVSRFMEDEELGRWKLAHIEVTPIMAAKATAIAMANPYRAIEVDRVIPAGRYIHLSRRMTRPEMEDAFASHHDMTHHDMGRKLGRDANEVLLEAVPDELRWQPIMSDTPSEIAEHHHALNNATGRVLITGLGLGCLPHALLAKPGIERIDIIEIDSQVIRLTGKYLDDPRVHIHHGSAAEPLTFFGQGTHFDYVWHDIWSQIADRNLDDDSVAEHGLSYRTLFDLYERCFSVGDTQAWAYEEAKEARRAIRIREAEEAVFQHKLKGLLEARDIEAAVDMVYERALRRQLVGYPASEPIRPEFLLVLDPEGEMREHLLVTLSDPEFWPKFDAEQREREADGSRSLGNPNDYMEV